MTEIALVGGSFNPPHIGHLLAAQYTWATQPVSEVWLLPSYRHPFGKAMAGFDHRLRMCQCLIDDTSGWLKVSDLERQLGGEGRTVDTLSHLTANNPDHRYTLVIGSDILGDLPHWRDVDRIRSLARLLVLHRAGYPAVEAVGPPLAEISSSEVRRRLAAGDDVSALVPRSVLAYIDQHRLYR